MNIAREPEMWMEKPAGEVMCVAAAVSGGGGETGPVEEVWRGCEV